MSVAVPLHHLNIEKKRRPAWRSLIKSMLPELYDLAKSNDASTYSFFSQLLEAAEDAHRRGDNEFLTRAYAFVYWAFDHPNDELWNPAGVCFLEHAFDGGLMGEVVSWLRPDMMKETAELVTYIRSQEMSKKAVTAYKAKIQNHVAEVNRVLASHVDKVMLQK